MSDIDFNSADFAGTHVAEWVVDLQSSDSRLHKEAVIERAVMTARLGSRGAQAFLLSCFQTYNPYLTFNFKKVPATENLANRANPWPEFWQLLDALARRNLTGHAARDRIHELSQEFNSDDWNLVCRGVIHKDLRAGISEKTLNKYLSKTQWKIPVFSCQLATDSKGRPDAMRGKKRLEQKLDGVRALVMIADNNTTIFSRNGRVFENFPHVIAAIDANRPRLRALLGRYPSGVVLDGEVMGESFQALMKQAQRKNDVKTADTVFNVFDIIPVDDFERGYWNAQQHKRLAELEKLRDLFDSTDCIRVMNGIEVDLDTAEGHDVLKRYANDSVNAGFEGIMIKDVDAPYECKRATAWLKWKPLYDYDLTIIGLEEGTGRNSGRTGALICEGEDDGKLIRVNVGSGLSDEQRDEFWKNQRAVIGQTAVVLADAVTQNQDGSYSLRFPRFKTFRDDK